MAMSAKHRSKFAAFQREWWRLHMSENISYGTKNPNKLKSYGPENDYVTISDTFNINGRGM